MKKIIAGLALVLALSACGAETGGAGRTPEDGAGGSYERIDVNGTTCIVYDADGGGGGIDCDFTNE